MKHSLLLYDPAIMSDSLSSTMLTERSLGLFQPLEISPEAYLAAYNAPIGDHVEKNYKGLSYLSWPFAFRYLKEHFPALYVAFEEASKGWPVFGQEGCYLVRPYLTDGARRTPALVFPLMDNKHNALQQLDARAVSDNIQRASVKAIATFTGLGLKLYAGEDVPKESNAQEAATRSEKPAATTKPATRRSTTKEAASTTPEPAGEPEAPAASPASLFDGKVALLTVCKSNPLGFPDERSSLVAGKAALQHLGLNKGEDIKDVAMLANVVTTMVSQWISKEGVKIGKEEMKGAVDKLRAICEEGTVEQAVQGIQAFVAAKK